MKQFPIAIIAKGELKSRSISGINVECLGTTIEKGGKNECVVLSGDFNVEAAYIQSKLGAFPRRPLLRG